MTLIISQPIKFMIFRICIVFKAKKLRNFIQSISSFQIQNQKKKLFSETCHNNIFCLMDNQYSKNYRSITEFVKKSKPQRVKEKKQRKEQQKINSIKTTQLSLFGWLLKNRPKQNCKITTLPKNMIINIYSFLRVSDILIISQSCSYFQDCAKSVWNSSQFFGELETDKLTANELKKLIQKSSRLTHIKALKSIYKGKNLRSMREKIKLKVYNRTDHNIKPPAGKLLEVFEVAPKNHKTSSFLMDSHLTEIANSSFTSLRTIKLHLCLHIKKFNDLSRCTELTTLQITGNPYINKEDMRKICKSCLQIQVLDLSGCSNLDQNFFKHLSKLEHLRRLSLKNYNQSFGDCFQNLSSLQYLNIENSCIVDQELINIGKSTGNLKQIYLTGCKLLTDYSLTFIKNHEIWKKSKIQLGRTNISFQLIDYFQSQY